MSSFTLNNARLFAHSKVLEKKPRAFDRVLDEHGTPKPTSSYYGSNVFGQRQLERVLPPDVYKKLIKAIETSTELDDETSAAVAFAVKNWAVSRGATHYAHWFQPQTGSTAEKHDAFLDFSSSGEPIEKLSAQSLVQSEPDASSFPSGGMRSTFEARGYTAWDPSSPMFLVEYLNNTILLIPSIFVSYRGSALDERTVLLRSLQTLSKKATHLLHILGVTDVKKVHATLGIEQEYFLVEREFSSLREDLIKCGRTVLGAPITQTEDHYFGCIPPRVIAYMCEAEQELYKLGIPAKTRHNEVAPSQYELAPIFEFVDIACDHNQTTMNTLRSIAQRHDFTILFHPKPFAGVNGSGKHCNWSLQTDKGLNLLDPQKTNHFHFLLFLIAVLKGINKYSGLLSASIASAGNDLRLGANEAPPSIISVFLGDHLTNLLDKLENGTFAVEGSGQSKLESDILHIPRVLQDNTDRNRTSPFAFTGNKFEFRAVAADASPAFPVTLLNTCVIAGLDEVIKEIETKRSGKSSLSTEDLMAVIIDGIKETKRIRFEGNGYSAEWVQEATKRGLPVIKSAPEALEYLVSPITSQLLKDQKIYSHIELESRYNVLIERYISDISLEAGIQLNIINTQVIPATYSYLNQLSSGALNMKQLGIHEIPQLEEIHKINSIISTLKNYVVEQNKNLEEAHHHKDDPKLEAKIMAEKVRVTMNRIRVESDKLEGLVNDSLWPVVKYRELLYKL